MNPVLGIIGNMLGGAGSGGVGNAQANSVNGMGNSVNSGNAGLNSILGLFGMLKGSSDPMKVLQSMSQTNPNIKQAMDFIQQNGGDPQAAFYKLAEQKGIDPNNILSMIK